MLNIIGRKKWYFIFSLVIIIPGIFSLLMWGLPLSIDFTGGTRVTLSFSKPVDEQTIQSVKNILEEEKIEVVTSQPSENRLIIRTKPMNEKQDAAFLKKLQKKDTLAKQEEFETVGPTI